MSILIFAMAFSCGPIQIMNTSKYEWNSYDAATLAHAKKRCGEIYRRSPCLKVFFKVDKQDYKAICGAEDEKFIGGPTLWLSRKDLKL